MTMIRGVALLADVSAIASAALPKPPVEAQ